ncbi:MAG: hypothetical protein ACHBN1_07405 [Heteroscytonema crispum UTEX LB 1556]
MGSPQGSQWRFPDPGDWFSRWVGGEGALASAVGKIPPGERSRSPGRVSRRLATGEPLRGWWLGVGWRSIAKDQCPMPNAQCPIPNAQFPMPNAQCPMPNNQQPTNN